MLAPFDGSVDHFTRLGLERGWKVDRNALEDGYLDRSKLVHPDRFVTADSSTRRAALEHSSALNEAYQVVRDAVRRAEYLVKLGGIDLDSNDPSKGAPHPTQAFLIEMIERRERLDEVRAAGEAALETLQEEIDEEIESVFDSAVAALAGGDIAGAASSLVHRRYLQRFLNEVAGDH